MGLCCQYEMLVANWAILLRLKSRPRQQNQSVCVAWTRAQDWWSCRRRYALLVAEFFVYRRLCVALMDLVDAVAVPSLAAMMVAAVAGLVPVAAAFA